MKRFIILSAILIPIVIYSQTKGVNELTQINSDNQDNYSLRMQITIHEIFKGNISRLDSNTFKFDDKVLFVINTPYDLSKIVDLGILYPDIIAGTGNANNVEIDTNDWDSTVIVLEYKKNKTFDSIFGSDSLTISNLREINSSQNTFKIKKFSFLLFRNGFANPIEYFIELINDKSNKNMDLETFIKGARLINIEKGSILI
jgi:hypothetical protein